jgi:hypothetical protein
MVMKLGELKIIGKSPIIMDGDRVKGELNLTWRKDNPEEIVLAKKTFNEYLHKGWLAIGETEGKKIQIFTFNPELDKIVLTPLVVGG